MNKNLASELRSAISDSRLEVIEQSASDLGQILIERKIQSVDFIISGIPFSLMSKIDKRNLCVEAARFLSVKGTLVIYQARFPGGQFLVEKTIRPWFQVKRSRAMMFNLPPLYVLEAKLRTTLSV